MALESPVLRGDVAKRCITALLAPFCSGLLGEAVAGSNRVGTFFPSGFRRRLLRIDTSPKCQANDNGQSAKSGCESHSPRDAAEFFCYNVRNGRQVATDWLMALYRCEAKIISRSDGHSAVAAAAYRTGQKIKDELTGRIHDYLGRQKGIIQSVILRPDNAPAWAANTATLWNEAERHERRKDSQVCREFILAMPKELSSKEQFEAAVGWAQKELVSAGMIVEVSLHHPKGSNNPHCHLQCTMRKIDGDKFSAKKSREWNEKEQLLRWRESWCAAENAALEKAGRPERVDHRSLKAQGIDRLPQIKIGKEATAMKRNGTVADPERFKEVRKIKLLNDALPFLRAIQRQGHVQHYGMAASWWDKTMFAVSRLHNKAKQAVKAAWQKLVESRRDKGPERER
jgi:hypothetical protein